LTVPERAAPARLRRGLSRVLAACAVLLGVACVVLVVNGWPLSVATGAAGLSASGFAGMVHPKSRTAPVAFLVCVAAIGAALVLNQVLA
jgi:hypothetical protein